jgi:hypothetical protein
MRWESTMRCKSPRITVAARNRNSVVMIKAVREAPNENKVCDGHRERALIGAEIHSLRET